MRWAIICLLPDVNTVTDGAEEEFAENMDVLHEIIEKFKPNCDIMICGDLNSNITNPKTTRDTRCRDFFIKHGFQIPDNSGKNTFYHHNGKGVNSIDYILCSNQKQLQGYHVDDRDSRCSSSHVHVTATVKLSLDNKKVIAKMGEKGGDR